MLAHCDVNVWVRCGLDAVALCAPVVTKATVKRMSIPSGNGSLVWRTTFRQFKVWIKVIMHGYLTQTKDIINNIHKDNEPNSFMVWRHCDILLSVFWAICLGISGWTIGQSTLRFFAKMLERYPVNHITGPTLLFKHSFDVSEGHKSRHPSILTS